MHRVLLPRVLWSAVLFGLVAWACLALTRQVTVTPALWLANGMLVGLLLDRPRGQQFAAVPLAWLTNTLANLAGGYTLALAAGLAMVNGIEVAIALWALGPWLRGPADLFQQRVLSRFFGAAVLLAPLVAALLGSAALARALGVEFAALFSHWYGTNALGMAVAVPLALALRPGELRLALQRPRWYDSVLPLLLLVLTTLLLFSQSRYPLFIVVLPPLLMVTFRLGFAGSALGIVLVVAVSAACSLTGAGPLLNMPFSGQANRLIAMQLFVATMILITFPVSAMLAAQDKLLKEVAASEQRFRVIAENSSDLVGLIDVDGLWRYVSPSVTALFGWEPQQILGTDGTSFVHPDDVAGYRSGVRLLAGGQEVLKGVFRVRHRDGHYVWVETICRLLRDERGQPSGWVSNSRDISTRKRIERIKDEFVSTVNHELRTPLTAMTASVGLALSGRFGPLSETVQRLLEMAKSNGMRLAKLVDDILDFEKVSSGNMQFRLRPQAVDTLVENSINANRAYAMQFEVALLMRQRAPDTMINVDADRFQQVMSNLLSNAAKFSKRGGQVEIDAVVSAGRCRISVVDHGCGIPAAFRNSLFERFAQADGSDRRTQGGTGLGMAIAKHLTEGMAGSISYESEEGQGTTFQLEFALASAVIQEAVAKAV